MMASTSPVRGSRFRSNVLRIATGTMLSQVIVIGCTPLLTRLYAPEAFGALALFTALNTILAGLFTLKYDLSIILPAERDEAEDLTRLTLTSSVLFSLLLLLGLGLAQLGWPDSGLQAYQFLLPLSTLLSAAYTCAQQWAARANDYGRFSRSQVVGASINVALSLTVGLASRDATCGLVLGWVGGLLASLLYVTAGRWPAAVALRLQRGALLQVARSHRRFPLFVLPTSMTQTLGNSAQPFILQALFSLRDVGQYAIANRFLLVPSTLVGSAIAEAFRAEFVARMKQGDPVSHFFRATFTRMLVMGLPVFLLLLLSAPALFALAFGSDYREAGTLARYLGAGVLAQFVAQPFAYVFIATGQVRRGLAIQVVTTATPLLAMIYGGLQGDVILALALASGTSFVLSALMIMLAYQACRAWEAARD